jgi:TPR repeat protein
MSNNIMLIKIKISSTILLISSLLPLAAFCQANKINIDGLKLYQQGKFEESINPLKESALNGKVKAAIILAEIFKLGKGVSKDLPESFKWRRLAADLGDRESQETVAAGYSSSSLVASKMFGTTPSSEDAIKYYRLAASQGSTLAMNNIQLLLKDINEIIKYEEMGAQHGDDHAQSNLGIRYLNGDGVVRNYKTAFSWIERSAKQGNVDAQGNLSFMYLKGFGVPQNFIYAYVWGSIGAANGDKTSEVNRNVAHTSLNSQSLIEAQKIADKCKKSSYKNCN